MEKLLTIILILTLTGCLSLSKKASKSTEVYLSKDLKFKLISLRELNKNIILEQQFAGKYKSQKFSFNVISEIKPQSLSIIGLSEFGSRIFTINFDDYEVNYQLPKFLNLSSKIDLKYMIADFELIYFPLNSLKKNLNPNLKVEEKIIKGKLQRIFYRQKKPFIKITYNLKPLQKDIFKSDINFINLERNYQYSITNLNHAK